MRVLVACEFSRTVANAFERAGHEVLSCDLLPAEQPGNHYQGDVRDVLNDGWDLMIAHPPCTYLANSGVRWLYTESGRFDKMVDAAMFFSMLLECRIPRIAVENPIMHGHGKKLVSSNQTQTIQPWQFGHGETKAICLWLRNLPALEATNIVEGRKPRVHHASPGPDRWKERSRFYRGIADAMAEQWGQLPLPHRDAE